MRYTGINKEWLEEHDKQVRAEATNSERERVLKIAIGLIKHEGFLDVGYDNPIVMIPDVERCFDAIRAVDNKGDVITTIDDDYVFPRLKMQKPEKIKVILWSGAEYTPSEIYFHRFLFWNFAVIDNGSMQVSVNDIKKIEACPQPLLKR